MKLHELAPAAGATKAPKRIGRGTGSGTEITVEFLKEQGVIKKALDGLKVLGDGELTKKLSVKAVKFTKSAEEKIKNAGGTAEVID